MVRTTYATDDPAEIANTYDISSERHLEEILRIIESQPGEIDRVWEVDEDYFSTVGLKAAVAMLREHRWNHRQEALAEGRFQNRDGDGLSTSAKIGIVAGLIVLIAVAAMIRQRIRA